LKLGEFLSLSVDTVDAKFCICNLRSISQAGRRGFESHLPLHVFIYLQGFQACKKPTFRGNGAKASSELVDSLILERLTGSEPRWPSYIKDAGLSLLPKPDTRGWDEYELDGSSSNGTIARDGDLLLDTQAVLVGPGMDSNHELYRFLKFRMLLILQSRRSRRNPQKQGHGTKSVQNLLRCPTAYSETFIRAHHDL
jgi:hypothetical protein